MSQNKEASNDIHLINCIKKWWTDYEVFIKTRYFGIFLIELEAQHI